MNNWVLKYLTDEDQQKISTAVQEVEKQTSCEIVPMVVFRSADLRLISVLIFLSLVSVLFLVGFLFYESYFDFVGRFGFILLSIVISGFVAWLTPQSGFIMRLLLPRSYLSFEVFERARVEFFENKLSHTKNRNAILIFLSIFEHEAIVMADRNIAEKIPQAAWDGAIFTITQAAKQRQMAQGLLQAIQAIGEKLKVDFPIDPQDTNELCNKLIVKL